MTKHRDRIGIIADLLKAAGKGARKTRIMYIANLSHGLLRKYLGLAVSLGYLTLEGLRSHGRRQCLPEKVQRILEQILKRGKRTGKHQTREGRVDENVHIRQNARIESNRKESACASNSFRLVRLLAGQGVQKRRRVAALVENKGLETSAVGKVEDSTGHTSSGLARARCSVDD